jgi:hypothetical protein
MWEFFKSPGVDLLLLIVTYLALRAMRHWIEARQGRRTRASASADGRRGPADTSRS